MWTEVHLSDSWHSEVLGQNNMSKRKSNLYALMDMFEISESYVMSVTVFKVFYGDRNLITVLYIMYDTLYLFVGFW